MRVRASWGAITKPTPALLLCISYLGLLQLLLQLQLHLQLQLLLQLQIHHLVSRSNPWSAPHLGAVTVGEPNLGNFPQTNSSTTITWSTEEHHMAPDLLSSLENFEF